MGYFAKLLSLFCCSIAQLLSHVSSEKEDEKEDEKDEKEDDDDDGEKNKVAAGGVTFGSHPAIDLR